MSCAGKALLLAALEPHSECRFLLLLLLVLCRVIWEHLFKPGVALEAVHIPLWEGYGAGRERGLSAR